MPTYLLTDGRTRTDRRMDGRTDGQTEGQAYVRTYVRSYLPAYLPAYLPTCQHAHTHMRTRTLTRARADAWRPVQRTASSGPAINCFFTRGASGREGGRSERGRGSIVQSKSQSKSQGGGRRDGPAVQQRAKTSGQRRDNNTGQRLGKGKLFLL